MLMCIALLSTWSVMALVTLQGFPSTAMMSPMATTASAGIEIGPLSPNWKPLKWCDPMATSTLVGIDMVSPPFATAKAGDDFPFRNPSTNGTGKMPNIQRKFLKKFLFVAQATEIVSSLRYTFKCNQSDT